MRGLDGKIAIVTGATGDMGRAVAERLAAEGAKVVCCGRDRQRGELCIDGIRAMGKEATFVCVDISDENGVKDAVKQATTAYGRLDIVVNLAAATDIARAGGLKRIAEETNEGLQYQLDINLIAPFWFYKNAIPEMRKTGGGNFVNISSLAASKVTPSVGAYAMSKVALEALSRQVAAEYSSSNIRSNCIGLGGIRITQSAPLHDHPAAGPAIRQTQIIDRSGTPDDVASMVAFLASDESSFITGEVLPLDGGAAVKMVVPDLSEIYK